VIHINDDKRLTFAWTKENLDKHQCKMSNNVVYEALSITTDTGIHYVGSSVTHLYIYRPSVSQKLEQNTSSN